MIYLKRISHIISIMKKIEGNFYIFDSQIYASSNNGAYVIFPWDIQKEFNVKLAKVKVFFEDILYFGNIINMGLKSDDNKIIYLIGIKKEIRIKLNKKIGDTINVKLCLQTK